MYKQASCVKGAQDKSFQYNQNLLSPAADHRCNFDQESLTKTFSSRKQEDPDHLAFNLTSATQAYHALTGIAIQNDRGTAILPHSIAVQGEDAQVTGDSMNDLSIIRELESESIVSDSMRYNVSFRNVQIPIEKSPNSHGVSIRLPGGKSTSNVAYSYSESDTSMIKTPRPQSPHIPLGSFTNCDASKLSTSTEFNPQSFQTSVLQNDTNNNNNNTDFQTPAMSQTVPLATSLSTPSNIDDPKEAFTNILPLLRGVTPRNFSDILVHCLREYHHHISLESLFNLLYSGKCSYNVAPCTHTDNTQGGEIQGKVFRICCLILNWFHDAQPSRVIQSNGIRKEEVSQVSFHEVLRTFLAIKVLFACIEQAGNNSMHQDSISRVSCYKVYYLICQKLSKTRKFASNFSFESIILGHSRLGHLIRSVFPNLVSKRLGSRGKSRFHYIGLRWNHDIVDDDMLKVLDVEIPQLRKYCKDTGPISEKEPEQKMETDLFGGLGRTRRAPQEFSKGQTPYVWSIPLHSFVDISYRYPDCDCSPRIWHVLANQVPPQSKWSTQMIERSKISLSQHKIDLRPLIANIKDGHFSNQTDIGLSATISRSLNTLHAASARKEVYMDLYLLILLLLFPVVIASDSEVPLSSKAQLRVALSVCVLDLEAGFSGSTDVINLRFFIANLKRMLNLSTLTSCKLQPKYAEIILQEKVSELDLAVNSHAEGFLLSRSRLEDLNINAIIRSLNAFSFEPTSDNYTSSPEGNITSICMLANSLVKALMMSKHDMHMLLVQSRSKESAGAPQDLPYQVFRIVIQSFHEYSLAGPLVKSLPIPVFNYALRNICQRMQSSSIDNFQKDDVEFSKENFKCWWVFFMMCQDYLDILSEIVSLSVILSKTP